MKVTYTEQLTQSITLDVPDEEVADLGPGELEDALRETVWEKVQAFGWDTQDVLESSMRKHTSEDD